MAKAKQSGTRTVSIRFSCLSCPICSLPVRQVELATYGRCEDCWTIGAAGWGVTASRLVAAGSDRIGDVPY